MTLLIPHIGKRLIASLAPQILLLNRQQGTLALTFDDGPHQRNTPLLLDILEARGIQASFFLTGREAEKHQELTRDIHLRGHLVCNHGYSHLRVGATPGARYLDDMERCQALLESICAQPLPKLFRPPHGQLSLSSLMNISRRGYQTILWNRDSLDSQNIPAHRIKARIASLPMAQGDILLFHDDYEATPQALPEILDRLLDMGHGFTRLDR